MGWGAAGRRCSTCQVLKLLLAASLASSGGCLQTQELLSKLQPQTRSVPSVPIQHERLALHIFPLRGPGALPLCIHISKNIRLP